LDYKKVSYKRLAESNQRKSDINFSWLSAAEKGIVFLLENGDELLVRRMDANDVEEVLEIERATFPAAWSSAGFFYRLHDRQFNVSLVAFVGDRLVAYAVSYAFSKEFHFSNVAVRRNFRRRKFGEVLLWMSLHIGVELGCTEAHLEVRRNNISAIRLYEKFGFKIYGVRKNYYQQENEDAFLMRKEIGWELPYGMV